MSRIGITGAKGNLGTAMARHLVAQGHDVVRMGRTSPVPFDLDRPPTADELKALQLDALIHAAFDFGAGRESLNVRGSRALLTAARDAGIPTRILISSTAAFDGCVSLYGNAKLACEGAARDSGAWIVRPGLIVGEPPAGLTAKLAELAQKLPFLPLPGDGRAPMFPVWRDDLCALLEKMAAHSGPARPDPVVASAKKPSDLRRIVCYLAGRHVSFLPIPWRLVYGGLKGLEAFGFAPRFRSDSLVSMIHAYRYTDFSARDAWGVKFREFAEFPRLSGG